MLRVKDVLSGINGLRLSTWPPVRSIPLRLVLLVLPVVLLLVAPRSGADHRRCRTGRDVSDDCDLPIGGAGVVKGVACSDRCNERS